MTEATDPGSSGAEKVARDADASRPQPPKRFNPRRTAAKKIKQRRPRDAAVTSEVPYAPLADRLAQVVGESGLHADTLASNPLDFKRQVQSLGLDSVFRACGGVGVPPRRTSSRPPARVELQWDKIEQIAKTKGLSMDDLWRRAKIARSTFFNRKAGLWPAKTSEIDGIARVLGVHPQEILLPHPLHASGGEEQPRSGSAPGGITLTEQAATLVGWLDQLTDDQQETMMRVVERTMRAMGFSQPTAPGSGPARGRLTTGPKVRT